MYPLFGLDFHRASAFLTVAVVTIVGMISGVAAQRLRLPSIIGPILGGLAIGHARLSLFGSQSASPSLRRRA